jgi:tagatose-6-phosphate ketose/aldose isomerase
MTNGLTRLLSMSESERSRRGVRHTAPEIAGQAGLWKANFGLFERRRDELQSFLEPFRAAQRQYLVCCGAGTSEFVGHCLEGLLQQRLRLPVKVVSTTRIVTTPAEVFVNDWPLLLVSFARSGNSPESLGAVRIAEQLCPDLSHLLITCNPSGALAQEAGGLKRSLTLLLDERCDDRGLAMTASFSNLVVAGQMLAHLDSWARYRGSFDALCALGAGALRQAPDATEAIARWGFDRAVFLGDGAHAGTAVESHLKLQEMTAGKVMCTWDTFAGLRHGPEAVIHSNTLVVAYLSADGFAQAYELDLLRELRHKRVGRGVLAVCQRAIPGLEELADTVIECAAGGTPVVPDNLAPPAYVIVGQLLGLFTSLQLGLSPDDPSPSGVIHRVVEGVRVYDPRAYARNGELSVLAER